MEKGNTVGEQEKKEIAFSNRDLRRLIVPLLIEQMLNCTVGLLDSLMVSTVGEAAVSAVSLVDCVNVLLLQVFAALAAGGAIVAGQYIGCRETKKACKAGQQLLLSLGVLSLAVMALMYLLADFLLHVVFGTVTPEVSGYAQTYLMIVNLSIPFIALYNGGAALFRVMGNSRISMLVALLMNAVNVGGNALLVFGFGMGVAGVAIPTVLSRVVAAAVILALLCGKRHEIHLQRGMSWRPDWGMVRNIMSVGVPNGVENSLFQLGKIVMLSLISTCGTASIAANAIGNNVAQYQILGGMSVGIAMVTVVSQCVGAGDYEKVRAYTRKLVKLSYLFILLMVGLTLALLPLYPAARVFCLRVLAPGLYAAQYAAGGRRRQIYHDCQCDGDVDRTHWLWVFAGRLFRLGRVWGVDGYDSGLVLPHSGFPAALPWAQMGAYVVGGVTVGLSKSPGK